MPQAFIHHSFSFDAEPTDQELVWLFAYPNPSGCLVDVHHIDQVTVAEDANMLEAKPQKVPMKFAVIWTVILGAGMTAFPWIARSAGAELPPGLAWIVGLMLWLFIIPAILGILYLANAHYEKQEGYYRVDKSRLTLELLRFKKTFDTRHIRGFTQLTRWFQWNGWQWVRQVGVLVLADDGKIVHYPMVSERIAVLFRRNIAEQLSEIFNVPVRQIELSLKESKSLNDC